MGIYIHREGKKPHVAVPNDVFDRLCEVKEAIDQEKLIKTTKTDVVEAFTLYFVCLLRMDWNRDAEIQMKRLITRYFGIARSETFSSINRYLDMLKMANLIDYNGDKYTGSNIVCVKVMPVLENKNKYSLIACVNEHIITSCKTETSNTPFALHCLLNIKRPVKNDKREPVEIGQVRLAECLMVGKDLIRGSVDLLFRDGYIRRSPTQNYTTSDGKARSQCLLYTVHDYDDPVDNTNVIDGIERQKTARKSQKSIKANLKELFQGFGHTPILLIGDCLKVVEQLRQNDKDLKRTLLNAHEIETMDEVEGFVRHYYKKEPGNDMFLMITLPANRYTASIQERLLKFIEDSDKQPIVILSEHDYIIAPLLSRMKQCLKKSSVTVHALNLAPVHKGYESYEQKYKYYSHKRMIDHALNNCHELMPPTVTNPEGSTALYQLDSLISKLTGGKTYIDILSSGPDVTADIPAETKLLSLSLRRADLAPFPIGDYETAIQHKAGGTLTL